jgi:hypothetical protein
MAIAAQTARAQEMLDQHRKEHAILAAAQKGNKPRPF